MKKLSLLLLFLLLAGSSEIYSQFSPGELSDAHSAYEGLSNCNKCHEAGEKVSNAKCLDCHKEIKTLINNGRGYHSSSEVQGKNCYSCHSEHNGRKFNLIRFDQNKFDHSKTKYQLTGKHAKAQCRDCHTSKNIANAELKKRKNTWLGLEQNCRSCHEDFHQGTLSTDCASCHKTERFKPASLFNHDKAQFRLTGAHVNTDCSKCHRTEKRNGKDFRVFKGLAFAQCSSCHKDPHEGKFGANCASCHVTDSFSKIVMANFNHALTNFPLAGKHADVKCSGCHGNDLMSKPKSALCTDCHQDKHNGDFTKNNILTNCAECHTVEGFTPSQYTIERHQVSQFPLAGGHLAQPCQSCHMTEPGAWKFRVNNKYCTDCHKNPHGTELTARYLPDNDCMACHNKDEWRTIKFDHGSTDFRLEGKHSTINCIDCHVTGDKNPGSRSYRFASTGSDCLTCHKDIHFGQFIREGKNECFACHGFNDWKPVKFDHAKTQFPLTGAHAGLKCANCHKPVSENGNTYTKFKLEDFKCAACHSS